MTHQVTIIICTRDRADSLRATIESIGTVAVPADMAAELLIVDNGSTDQTAQVARDAALRNMPVRYAHEPRKGKGHAYNTGMAKAAGDVFLFTDDDVRPPANWIEEMCRPIIGGQADAVAGGVEVAPGLTRAWMIEGFPAFGASVCPSEHERDILLVGANMAFSLRVLQQVPQFDPELGPGALGFGEESLFCMQLREAGFRVIAAGPDATVIHHFAADRLKPKAVMETARKMARSEAYLHYHWHHKGFLDAGWGGRLRKSMAMVGRYLFKHHQWQCEENPPYWLLHPVMACSFVGQYMRERRVTRKYRHPSSRRRVV